MHSSSCPPDHPRAVSIAMTRLNSRRGGRPRPNVSAKLKWKRLRDPRCPRAPRGRRRDRDGGFAVTPSSGSRLELTPAGDAGAGSDTLFARRG